MTPQKANMPTSELIKALYHVNLLVTYPITDGMLEIWASSIQKLKPEITPAVLTEIIDQMKLGKINYDPQKGIQNIFYGYDRLKSIKLGLG